MSRLPPVEKLPLAVRKNLRDEWESKKIDLEERLSQVMGEPWKVNIDPNQVYAYATDGYAKESLGNCIASYVDGAVDRLKEFGEKQPEGSLNDINVACHCRELVLELDDAGRFTYCGGDIHEGRLRLLFSPGYLGTNIGDPLRFEVLTKAINDASVDDTMSFAARTSIKKEYEPKVEAIRSNIGKILNVPGIKLTPNFEAIYAKLLEESKKGNSELMSDWQSTLGPFVLSYWEGLVSQLQWQHFDSDELLQEGFSEAVEKGEIAFRVVDQLKTGTYGEALIEDGIMYLQCVPKYWGTNAPYIAEKLVDML